jgi:RluA family pseudouridine synthase
VRRRNFPITKSDQETTIFDFLIKQGFSEQEIQSFFQQGQIFLNEESAGEREYLSYRDILSIRKGAKKERSVRWTAKDLKVLYEDNEIVAYDKPSGFPVVAERKRKNTGLLGLLRETSGNPQGPPYLVHRLDRGTSGVWILAKTLHAKRHLTQQFVENRVKKQYRVQVQGFLHEKEGLIDVAIAPHPGNAVAMILSKKGKTARTKYKCLEQFRRFAIIRAWPLTGRTHQIRLHMRYLGHPLIIDELYGGLNGFYLSKIKAAYKKAKNRPENPIINRLTLHAEQIELLSAVDESKIVITSPLPKDLIRLERNLQNYG